MNGGPGLRPTWAEIDLDAIRHNIRRIAEVADGAEICAVVKADGYGHGAVPVARACLDAGATWLAVALVEEGEELRDAGIDVPILVFTEPPPDVAEQLLAADLTPTIYTEPFARALQSAGERSRSTVSAHLKLDTGMRRVGVPRPDWSAMASTLAGLRRVEVTGVWTHLARADEPDVETTDRQLDKFAEGLELLRPAGIEPELVHAANSAATFAHPRARFDLVRPGIAVYGLSPAANMSARSLGLRPALRWFTQVGFVKRISRGDATSYGHRWSAPADGWLASLPVGYADGVPRLLTNRAEVLIGGERCPIAGSVCMDQTLAWCGDQRPDPGDEVVLLGRQNHEEVTADEWAGAAETITYEIACGVSGRVPRVHRGV